MVHKDGSILRQVLKLIMICPKYWGRMYSIIISMWFYVPVVEKQILWSKRCKDKSLVGTVKETIMQVSSSKKWLSNRRWTNGERPFSRRMAGRYCGSLTASSRMISFRPCAMPDIRMCSVENEAAPRNI